jgi:ABC-type multidrug transport system permease subunit
MNIFVHMTIALTTSPAVGDQEIGCSVVEFVTLNPPSGTTCASYLTTYIERAGGYLANPGATSACHFCTSRTSDEYLWNKFHIKYHNHWWHLGVFCGFVIFNVRIPCFACSPDKQLIYLTAGHIHLHADVAPV